MERNFDVRIVNGAGCDIYGGNVVAKDENEAVIKLLTKEHVLLSSGDTITIEELY